MSNFTQQANWDDLRHFLAVARSGSVTQAAKKLGVAHTTVSRRITQLELKMGMSLFERQQSGYAPTPVGEELFGRAERMEAEWDAIAERAGQRDGDLGRVVLTAHETVGNTFMGPHLDAFLNAHPGLEVDFLMTGDLVNLNRREADIAIRATDNPPESLIGRRFGRAAYALYYPVARGWPFPGSEDGRSVPTLLYADRRDHVTNLAWFKKLVPEHTVRCRVTSVLAMMTAAKAGLGIARLPCFLADTEPELRRVPGTEVEHFWEVWLLARPEIRQTRRVRLVFDFLAERLSKARDLIEGERPYSET